MEAIDITRPLEKGWKVLDGKKTAIATTTWLILRVIDWKFPNAIDIGTQAIILDVATVLGTIGVGDKILKWWDKRQERRNIKNKE